MLGAGALLLVVEVGCERLMGGGESSSLEESMVMTSAAIVALVAVGTSVGRFERELARWRARRALLLCSLFRLSPRRSLRNVVGFPGLHTLARIVLFISFAATPSEVSPKFGSESAAGLDRRLYKWWWENVFSYYLVSGKLDPRELILTYR